MIRRREQLVAAHIAASGGVRYSKRLPDPRRGDGRREGATIPVFPGWSVRPYRKRGVLWGVATPHCAMNTQGKTPKGVLANSALSGVGIPGEGGISSLPDHTMLPTWANKAVQAASYLPSSFAELRKGQNTEWQKMPFGVHVEGNKNYLVVPSKEPDRIEVKNLLGLFISCAQSQNWIIASSIGTEADQSAFCNFILQHLGDLLGALMVIRSETISPKMVPTQDTAAGAWYVVSRHMGQTLKLGAKHPSWKFSYRHTLFSTVGTGWSAGALAFVTAVRDVVDRLIDLQGPTLASDDVKDWIKSKEWHLTACLGQQPVGGVYTPDEFEFLKAEYNRRSKKFDQHWEILSRLKVREMANELKGAVPYLDNLRVPRSSDAKSVETIRNYRLSRLSYLQNRRTKERRLVQGTTLLEKIKNMREWDNPRTPIELTWSPLYDGITKLEWMSHIINLAHRINEQTDVTIPGLVANYIDAVADAAIHDKLLNHMDWIGQILECYIELMQHNSQLTAWRGLFSPR